MLQSHRKTLQETPPKMRKVPSSLILLCTGVLLLLTSCKKPAPANGLFPVTLQTDWYPQPEHGGFYTALLKGYYKQEGLDVTINPGGPAVFGDQLVASGNATFGMSSSDKVLVSVSKGLPLVAVAATMQRDPQCVMVHAESPVQTFADLNGHSIAVQPGSIWFQYLVKKYHLDNAREIPATLSVANFLSDPNYIQQCFVTSEPYFAEKAGAKVRTLLIGDSGYEPYRVYETSESFLHDHPDIVAKFVRASTRGWRDYLADPTLANAEISKLNPAMSPGQMAFSYQALKDQHFLTGDGPSDPKLVSGDMLGKFTTQRWATLYSQLVDLKVITAPIEPAKAYTLQFLPQ